jgi:trimethylamine:corrinoid methyltransferase-like protein
MIDRQNWENWEASGSKKYHERVNERVLEILDAEPEPLLDEAMYKELRKVCELADERHKGEELELDMFG